MNVFGPPVSFKDDAAFYDAALADFQATAWAIAQTPEVDLCGGVYFDAVTSLSAPTSLKSDNANQEFSRGYLLSLFPISVVGED